ncbi:MAG TPA: sulfatase [Candidatus Binatia bacterium]|nr:sulfatase [Candidatus Binatia bacterium]
MRLRRVWAGAAGGLLGGALIGAVEALVAWAHAHGAGETPALAWALVVYGLVGGGCGLGFGVAAAALGTDGFALGLAGTAAGLGFVVARFRIVRDVLLEQVPHGPVPTLVQLGALAGTVAVAAFAWARLRGAEERARWLANPLGAAVLVGALAGAWAGGVALRGAPPAPAPVTRGPAPTAAPNVVLIVVDTLRADRLGCYGYGGAHTPRIDALAAEGTRYADTFAQASWTRPSFATIFTSLYPSSHGAVHKADSLPDRVDTVAEVLARAGYYTVGFPDNANISPAFNFGQGFAEYHYLAPALFFHADETAAELTLYSGLRLVRERFLARAMDVHHYYQPAEVVTAAVERWLDSPAARQRPFFLFVHYMDPHDPYFVHPFDGEGYARVANPNPPASVAEQYRRLYDGELAYLDEHLGALFDDLARRGLFDGSLIMLTGDHGEEFQEHGGWWHGTTLYDEQTHVPLIVKPPQGGARGRVVDGLTTSLDIAPTILAAARVPVPAAMQGNVLPLDDAPVAGRERVFSETDLEGNVVQAVRTPTWKFITANPGNPRGLKPEELYDLARDPGEHTDLAAQEPAERETLRAALGRSLLEARAHAGSGQQTDVDAVTQERLRALGYVN